ncbi:MAG: hypothetical protein CVV44_14265 [Spirochaetae bacterium HGW-Spirochaetae-1]|jgi:hypothetical protein|nr:MAG: hypothetical protein CVV44_14265 [Spirochaetae bacterium HGW-Spirochaetae-1]
MASICIISIKFKKHCLSGTGFRRKLLAILIIIIIDTHHWKTIAAGSPFFGNFLSAIEFFIVAISAFIVENEAFKTGPFLHYRDNRVPVLTL